jgi:hypothetical protein
MQSLIKASFIFFASVILLLTLEIGARFLVAPPYQETNSISLSMRPRIPLEYPRVKVAIVGNKTVDATLLPYYGIQGAVQMIPFPRSTGV